VSCTTFLSDNFYKTRNSAFSDKPRDAFTGQSTSQTWYLSIF